MYKKFYCKEINENFIDQLIKVQGWIRVIRNHGNVIFIDLYDYDACLQCVIEKNEKLIEIFNQCTLESVVAIKGVVKSRDPNNINNKISSGYVELIVDEIEILNVAKTLPFALHQENLSEELQMQYRFLYLRTQHMQNILKKRTEIINFARTFMQDLGFLEVQTPLLANSSDEGARDYVVPSRLNPGKFYALPQAPQQFKQLLMASGVEKYFQVAPCFRDEDPRSDRLVGEFYQLDFEHAFANQEDILHILENLLLKMFKHFHNIKQEKFITLTYEEAIRKYGSDKPDLRNPLVLVELDAEKAPNMFKDAMIKDSNFKVVAMMHNEEISNTQFKKLQELIMQNKGKGLAYCTLKNNEWTGPLSKMINQDTINYIKENSFDKDSNNCFLLAGTNAYELGNVLRNALGNALIDENDYKFCFIIDFPMFEKKDGKYVFTHNPFSMPKNPNDLPENIMALQYDVVCNGYEIVSGAVRNHKIDDIKKILKIVSEKEVTDQELFDKFPVFKSFIYGVPPHAGAALGLDRIVMLITKQKNVRDIVAFPLNQNGQNLLMNSPSDIDSKLKKELGLK